VASSAKPNRPIWRMDPLAVVHDTGYDVVAAIWLRFLGVTYVWVCVCVLFCSCVSLLINAVLIHLFFVDVVAGLWYTLRGSVVAPASCTSEAFVRVDIDVFGLRVCCDATIEIIGEGFS
jgi:hypothetical protein